MTKRIYIIPLLILVTAGLFSVVFLSNTPTAQALATCPANLTPVTVNGVDGCQDTAGSGRVFSAANLNQELNAQTGKPLPNGGSCGIGSVITFQASWKDCVFVPAASFIGTVLLSFFSFILSLVSSIFDWVFVRTVTEYSQTLTSLGLTNGIETAWSAFRDIANIVIIGMLTYVAIATILGIENYGYKALLANILIVAVFINFSLFFSRFIIDSSNFVSYQFYQSIQSSSSNGSVAEAFTSKMGLTGFWDTQAQLSKIGSASADTGAGTVLGLALAGSALMIIVIIVLLYGVILMFSRAVLLLFLMLVSSIAFASFLIPAFRENGWSRWWKTLWQAAFFGPLLTLFLWVSVLLLQSTSTDGKTSFAAILGNGPNAGTSAWQTIVLFVFVVGFLYASIQIASSVADQIAGFSATRKGILSTAAGAAVPASLIGGFLGRQTAGRLAAWRAQNMTAAAQARTERGDVSGAARAARAAARWESVSSRDFNFLNSAAGQALAQVGGIGGVGQTSVGGIAGIRTQQAERAAREAERAAVSPERQEELARQAIQAERVRQVPARTQSADDLLRGNADVDNANHDRDTIMREIRDLEQDRRNARNAGNAAQIATTETALAVRRTALQQVEARIEQARADITQARAEVENMEGDAMNAGVRAIQPLRTSNIARQAALQRPSRLWGALGNPDTDVVSDAAAEQVRAAGGEERLRNRLQSLRDRSWGGPPQTNP